MGLEKTAVIEAENRRWRIPEGYVCPDCVEDEFLKDIIRDYACRRECDYCGHRTLKHSAAPAPRSDLIFSGFVGRSTLAMAPLRGAIGPDKELEHVETSFIIKRNAIIQVKQMLGRSLSNPLTVIHQGQCHG